jgi:signal transduction histidine kinase
MVLWLASGILARRLGRPLWKLVEVTTQIGDGDLSARVRLGRHRDGEVGVLSDSINRMAERIDKQMNDQRELLAGVSHEIRTPLARLRIITELLREGSDRGRLLDEAEREIAELDELTGQLLASSRLEFVALEVRRLDASELCRTTLKRANLGPELFTAEATSIPVEADPTLIGRALLNLLHNAQDHGGSVVVLRLSEEAGRVRFSVVDDGPGFNGLGQAFDPFVQGSEQQSSSGKGGLGLGLALVKRIVLAHGGDVFVENLPEGGAQVGFWLPKKGHVGQEFDRA